MGVETMIRMDRDASKIGTNGRLKQGGGHAGAAPARPWGRRRPTAHAANLLQVLLSMLIVSTIMALRAEAIRYDLFLFLIPHGMFFALCYGLKTYILMFPQHRIYRPARTFYTRSSWLAYPTLSSHLSGHTVSLACESLSILVLCASQL